MDKTNKEAEVFTAPEGAVLSEVLAMLGDLRKEVAELKAARDMKLPKDKGDKVKRADHPKPGGAWVVRTPRQDYNGATANVQFLAGIAIVDEDAENADGIVHQLEHDFGYTVQAVDDAESVAAMRKLMAAPGKKTGLAEKMVTPQRM